MPIPLLKRPLLALLALLLLVGYSLLGGEVPDPEEPLFQPGEYGGEPLPGTEGLYNVQPNPDGEQIALIRDHTPGRPTDPRNQLWIVDRDGSNPRLIGVNVGTVDWSPDGKNRAVTVSIGINVYVYTIDLATVETQQWSGRNDMFFRTPP